MEMLAEYVASTRTTLEVCLTSNVQTMPELNGSVANGVHPLKKMLDRQMSVCIGTDNRLVSSTTVTDELRLATSSVSISPKQLKDMMVGSFKRSFFPAPYREKRKYVRSIINYYEQLEREFGYDTASQAIPASPKRPSLRGDGTEPEAVINKYCSS